MAFSYTLLTKTSEEETYHIFATADADTGGTVLHQLGTVPDVFTISPICTSCRNAMWTSVPNGLTATGVVLAKQAVGLSSNPNFPVILMRIALAQGKAR